MVNLFYLDHNPKLCAQYYCDKHVVKILVEICQILSQIHHEIGNKKPPYKKCRGISYTLNTYVWAKESINNYKYCTDLATALLQEYKFRYNNKEHKSEKALNWLKKNIPPINKKNLTKFKLTKNIEIYTDFYDDIVNASRLIYVDFKCKKDKWTKREIPDWFPKLKNNTFKKKEILKEKIMNMVKVELPKLTKETNISVKRFHSFLRISYDELFQMKWNKYIKQYPNMFNPKKPLIHQLGIAHLIKLLKIINSLKKTKNIQDLNINSLKYRNKL